MAAVAMTNFDSNLQQSLLNIYGNYMHLKIYVDSNDITLRNIYIDAVHRHNNRLYGNINHIDAGFDLYSPETKIMCTGIVNKLDYNIICSAKKVTETREYNTGFYMYPRSSISKSNVRLANNVGIIDAGYRGHLMGMFDAIYSNNAIIYKFDRHLQICAPGLIPIFAELVFSVEELGQETARGAGGFGSTGI